MSTTQKLAVIGNGMAGIRTIEELLKIAPDKYEITVFGAEPHQTTTASCCHRCWQASRRSTTSCSTTGTGTATTASISLPARRSPTSTALVTGIDGRRR